MFRREEERRFEEERMMDRGMMERGMMERGMMEREMVRRRRRRLMVGGAVMVGSTEAMVKMSAADAQRIEMATGMPPEAMSHEQLQQAMYQENIQPQMVTPQDQEAMGSAEATDP